MDFLPLETQTFNILEYFGSNGTLYKCQKRFTRTILYLRQIQQFTIDFIYCCELRKMLHQKNIQLFQNPNTCIKKLFWFSCLISVGQSCRIPLVRCRSLSDTHRAPKA